MNVVGDILPFSENIVGIAQYFKKFNVWQEQWPILGETSFIAESDVEEVLA